PRRGNAGIPRTPRPRSARTGLPGRSPAGRGAECPSPRRSGRAPRSADGRPIRKLPCPGSGSPRAPPGNPASSSCAPCRSSFRGESNPDDARRPGGDRLVRPLLETPQHGPGELPEALPHVPRVLRVVRVELDRPPDDLELLHDLPLRDVRLQEEVREDLPVRLEVAGVEVRVFLDGVEDDALHPQVRVASVPNTADGFLHAGPS